MTTDIRFDGRVAIVSGAGGGLGREHALALARRGARVVVNDPGATRDGASGDAGAAQRTVDDIVAAGGEAIADRGSVARQEDVDRLVERAMDQWSRVDILVHNAGIIRDKSFGNLAIEDWDDVFDVHVRGAFLLCKRLWPILRERRYGRIVLTTSSSGLYGNFGQANYSAAKMALIGLMNTLHIEGAKYDIRVNALAPTAVTRMTEELIPEQVSSLLTAESVTSGLLTLVDDEAPSRVILCAGAGVYSQCIIAETEGVALPGAPPSPEAIRAAMPAVSDPGKLHTIPNGGAQTSRFVSKAMRLQQH